MDNLNFTPLSLSKILKEKGIAQKSAFYHFKGKLLTDWEMRGMTMSDDNLPISAFCLSELPDAFRQVFGEVYASKIIIQGEWQKFCADYYDDHKSAWETLEKTIRSL